MKLLRRNLSLMLAVRYLNPLRTMFSVITLICLCGVALGVMVLIVVLSVMEGLQKEIEDKALAFAPHYVASFGVPVGGYLQRVEISDADCDWKGIIEKLSKEEDVECVYPRMEGDAFAQSDMGRMTIHFSALQAGNEAQSAPLREMIKEGVFDFGEGLDEECVISFETAVRLQLGVGDFVHITPVGNLDEVADIYTMIQKPMRTHENKEFMAAVAGMFADVPEDSTEDVQAPQDKVQTVINALSTFPAKELRQGEIDACKALYAMLMEHFDTPFTPEDRAAWNETARQLAALDRDKEDGIAVKSINRMTMPIDLKVVGIYQAPENMGGPNVYMPLTIAQNVLGLSENGEESIMGICVRVKDIHRESDIQERIYDALPRITVLHAHAESKEESTGDDAPPPLEDVELEEGVAPEAPPATEPIATVEETPAEAPAEPVAAAEEPEPEVRPVGVSVEEGDSPYMWLVTPWTENFEKWSELIANERTMMSFVLSIISLIASFCIMAVMFTMSIQRKREIAVLQALGATPGKIMGIFAWQGLIIGFVGAVLGIILALLVLYYRLELQAALATIGMDPFPMQAHGITLPANYDPVTFAQQAFTAFIMVVIAAIIPAFIVSRQDPAKALRSN